MEQAAGAANRPAEGFRLSKIALGQLDVETVEVTEIGAAPDQDADRVTGADQAADDRGSDESGGAGDQNSLGHLEK